MADITGSIEVDGLVQQRKELDSLMMSNPEMEKRVQKLIRQVLMTARKEIGKAAQGAMKSDPRKAYKAVKTAVYRRILGGSVSILNRRSTKFDNYEPTRTLRPGQRGGNRRVRSQRTENLLHYAGESRAFVLRFLNQGTQDRETRYGRRGRITPRNFFGTSSHTAMQKAADQLTTLIDEMIKKEMN